MRKLITLSIFLLVQASWAGQVIVPAGAFLMGCSNGDQACEMDEGRPGGVAVHVPAYAIDTHEVTVAAYRACVEAGRCQPPLTHDRNRYCNYAAPGRDAHPVNCVDWDQAQTYCQWKGGRLPREAEWEKAARAGSNTPYPWGKRVDCRQAILDDGKTRGSAGDELDGCGEDRTWPVGSRKPNAFGLFDMHGNAGEWTGNGYPEIRTAVSALKAGAYDYLNKPFDLDDLKGLVARALETQRLRSEVERLRAAVPPPAPLEGMIGQSPAFLAMAEMTRRIAAAPRAPVLIRGESGTGKERVAQAIHSLSSRAAGPWVTLNGSAIAEGLLESEMFGHEKGAFTDAVASKRGLLELADGGTLFLDEIGDLSPALQPKLLRAIETQSFRRVGGGRELKVDVRFVAATNRDLNELIRQGRFREDLYYRLNVAGIDVPPLRERRDDILPLARHFLGQAAMVMGLKAAGIAPAARERLAAYVWPGNVRELRNVMERALILSGGEAIRPEHLPKELCNAANCQSKDNRALPFALADMEKLHITRVLGHCHGNKTHAAALLGITRLTLRNKIKQYQLPDQAEEGGDSPA